MRKNKRATIPPGQYILWPDENGILILPLRSGERSSGSQSRRLRHSRRVAKRARSSWVPLRYSASSLSLKNSAGAFYGVVLMSLFTAWLWSILFEAVFQMLTIAEIENRAAADLGLERNRTRELLIKLTRPGGVFEASEGLITFHG